MLHLTHTSFVTPLLHQLERSGVTVSKYLKKTGLNQFEFDKSGSFVPIVLFLDLLELVSNQEGINKPEAVFSEAYRLRQMGEWGEGLTHCPDLLSALKAAQYYDSQFQTNQKIWLETKGVISILHNIYFDINEKDVIFFEVASLALMIDGFHFICGEDWLPLEINTTLPTLESYSHFLPLDHCVVNTSQPSFGFVFPTADLANKIKDADTDVVGKLGDMPDLNGLSTRIEMILDNWISGPIPNIKSIAEYANISTRSLQRQLITEDSTYFQIVDDWRFKTALQLLSNPTLKISEIAEKLHYANPANFIRSFRRRTGVSPTTYREELS